MRRRQNEWRIHPRVKVRMARWLGREIYGTAEERGGGWYMIRIATWQPDSEKRKTLDHEIGHLTEWFSSRKMPERASEAAEEMHAKARLVIPWYGKSQQF